MPENKFWSVNWYILFSSWNIHCPFGLFLNKKTAQLLLGTDLFWNIIRPKHGNLWLTLLKKTDFIGVRGDNSRTYLMKSGIAAQKIFIPPNVFDFRKYSPKQKTPEYDLITIGSLVADKRMDILLKSVATVKSKIPDIRLAIVGDGKLKDTLVSLADKLGITDNVCFLGTQSNVADYLCKAKIFMLTSRTEGLPMAMIEALSCGLPVIVSNVGDIATVAKNRVNAILVEQPSPDAFAGAIAGLLTDKGLYSQLAQNALKIRVDYKYEYSLNNLTGIWGEVLDKCY